MRRSIRSLALLVAGAVAVSLAAASPAFASRTIYVHQGESIQAAINRAQPGDTIQVGPGRFAENLFMGHTKDDISLIGSGLDRTLLEMPAQPRPTPCDPNPAQAVDGICMIGSIGQGGPGPDQLTGVRVSGFTIYHFSGLGIDGFNLDHATIDHIYASNNKDYGIATFSSSNDTIQTNVATFGEEAGIYVGDSQDGNNTVTGNISRGNLFGIFIRDSSVGTISNNTVTDNCIGLMFLSTYAPVQGWTASGNVSSHNNKACPEIEDEGFPPTSGLGVVLFGASGNTFVDNTINSNRPSGPTIRSGGIVFFKSFDGNTPTGNTFTGNSLAHNFPFDINAKHWDEQNTFTANSCVTSQPAYICSGPTG